MTGIIESKHGTLVSNTVTTLTFTRDCTTIAVWSTSTGDADRVYFTIDGTTPTVKGDNTYLASWGGQSTIIDAVGTGAPVVKLIATGTPGYSVVCS